MNSKLFFIILLFLSGAVIFGLTVKPKQKIAAIIPTLSSQARNMGAVEVEIKPISVMPGKNVAFEISLNTHSVELNYDYTQIATLTDDRGNSYKPTKWTGGNSGHHVKGELLFAALPKNPKELTLTLEGVDNRVEVFVWQ